MNKQSSSWSWPGLFLTIAFCTVAYFLHSCQLEENKLRAKCIEAKGTWVGQQSNGGGCVIK